MNKKVLLAVLWSAASTQVFGLGWPSMSSMSWGSKNVGPKYGSELPETLEKAEEGYEEGATVGVYVYYQKCSKGCSQENFTKFMNEVETNRQTRHSAPTDLPRESVQQGAWDAYNAARKAAPAQKPLQTGEPALTGEELNTILERMNEFSENTPESAVRSMFQGHFSRLTKEKQIVLADTFWALRKDMREAAEAYNVEFPEMVKEVRRHFSVVELGNIGKLARSGEGVASMVRYNFYIRNNLIGQELDPKKAAYLAAVTATLEQEAAEAEAQRQAQAAAEAQAAREQAQSNDGATSSEGV